MTPAGVTQSIILEACQNAERTGDLSWANVQRLLHEAMARLPNDIRSLVEHELTLMSAAPPEGPALFH